MSVLAIRRPSLWRSISYCYDALGGLARNDFQIRRSDAEILAADCEMVFNDLLYAYKRVSSQYSDKLDGSVAASKKEK